MQAGWELVRPGLLAVKVSIPKEDLTALKSIMDHLLVTRPIELHFVNSKRVLTYWSW